MSAPLAIESATVAAVPQARWSSGSVEHRADRGLARGTDQDRQAEVAQFRKAAHDLEALIVGPAEAEARVDDQLLALDLGVVRQRQALVKARLDVADNVVEGTTALVVHHDRHGLVAGHESRHRGVATKARDVVDDAGARHQRRRRHLGAIRVDAHRQVDGGNDGAHDRHDALTLLLDADLVEVGPRRHAADVDDVGALFGEALCLLDRVLDARQPVARERLRRHVDDAHDVGAAAPDEALVADGELGREVVCHVLIVARAALGHNLGCRCRCMDEALARSEAPASPGGAALPSRTSLKAW